ncbi:MAG: hypothetical protein AAF416_14305 [Pseudomonadota bacterium]
MDLTPLAEGILGEIIPLLAIVIGSVLAAAASWAARAFGAKVSEDKLMAARERFEQAVQNGLEDYARTKISGPITVEIQNEAVEGVLSYLVDTVPDAVKTLAGPGHSEALRSAVRTRVGRYLYDDVAIDISEVVEEAAYGAKATQ